MWWPGSVLCVGASGRKGTILHTPESFQVSSLEARLLMGNTFSSSVTVFMKSQQCRPPLVLCSPSPRRDWNKPPLHHSSRSTFLTSQHQPLLHLPRASRAHAGWLAVPRAWPPLSLQISNGSQWVYTITPPAVALLSQHPKSSLDFLFV